MVVELEPPAYLKRIVERLKEEGERCDSVVGSELKGSILRAVEDEMIRGHVEGIAEKGEFSTHLLSSRLSELIFMKRYRYCRDVCERRKGEPYESVFAPR